MPETTAPGEQIRGAATELAALRGRPTLMLAAEEIGRPDLLTVAEAVRAIEGDSLDIVLFGHGGDIHSAYAIGREIRRRFSNVAIFVPLCAKSAATMICLIADDLVIGPLGELGPLDAQFDRKGRDFARSTSELTTFRAFEQLQAITLDFFDDAVGRIVTKSGMTPFDAAGKAAELTAGVFGHVYGQMDPIRVANAARALEVASAYSDRLLAWAGPTTEPNQRQQLLHRLVHSYPSHGFALDFDELAALGAPVRRPVDGEVDVMDRLAHLILPVESTIKLIEPVSAGPVGEPCAEFHDRQPRAEQPVAGCGDGNAAS